MAYRQSTIVRFWERVDKSGDCWLWQGYCNEHGYGIVRVGNRSIMAHRLAYLIEHPRLPPHLELDHLCRNRACVRPSHLEPVTHQENMRRVPWPKSLQTHCKRGHLLDAANTRVRPNAANGLPRRECRTCAAAREAARPPRRR